MPFNLIGFVQAFLTNINLIAQQNDPQYKVTPAGFLRMLMENNALTQINNLSDLQQGQDREIEIRYMQRGTKGNVTHVDDCDTPVTASWKNTKIGRPLYSKIGLFISEDEMRKYQAEAVQTTAAGTPAQPLMMGLYYLILTQLNGLIQDMDSQLVSAQASKFGNNIAYNPATGAKNINFGKEFELEDGYIKLLSDMRENEITGDIMVVGNGLVNAVDAYQKLKSGLDARGFGSLALNAYDDVESATLWGANHFGAFAKGTIGLVDFNKYVGSYAGQRGGSVFFTLPIPTILANGQYSALTLDAQLKYEDCPVYDSEGHKIADRGWKLILSKSFGLFNLPADAYSATDRLNGVNGAFHYVAAHKEAVVPTKEQA